MRNGLQYIGKEWEMGYNMKEMDEKWVAIHRKWVRNGLQYIGNEWEMSCNI